MRCYNSFLHSTLPIGPFHFQLYILIYRYPPDSHIVGCLLYDSHTGNKSHHPIVTFGPVFDSSLVSGKLSSDGPVPHFRGPTYLTENPSRLPTQRRLGPTIPFCARSWLIRAGPLLDCALSWTTEAVALEITLDLLIL